MTVYFSKTKGFNLDGTRGRGRMPNDQLCDDKAKKKKKSDCVVIKILYFTVESGEKKCVLLAFNF